MCYRTPRRWHIVFIGGTTVYRERNDPYRLHNAIRRAQRRRGRNGSLETQPGTPGTMSRRLRAAREISYLNALRLRYFR